MEEKLEMMCLMGLAGGASSVREEYPSEKEASSLNHAYHFSRGC